MHNNYILIGPMKELQPFILVLLFSYVVSQCLPFSNRKCEFSFEGEECAFAYCTSSEEAINTQKIYNDWQICLASCCSLEDASAPHFLSSLIKACADREGRDDNDSEIYGLGFGVGLALALIAAFYCFGLERLKNWFSTSARKKLEQSSLQINSTTKEPIQDMRKFTITEENLVSWMGTCCICLGDQTNIQTSCSHNYHASCIMQWYKRKPECPQCRKSCKQAKHTLFCRSCLWITLLTSLTDGDSSCKFCN